MVCPKCNKNVTTKLHKHHINGNHEDDRAANVVYICRACHSRAHIGPNIGKPWSEHLPYGYHFPKLGRDEVKSQYNNCFPRS